MAETGCNGGSDTAKVTRMVQRNAMVSESRLLLYVVLLRRAEVQMDVVTLV